MMAVSPSSHCPYCSPIDEPWATERRSEIRQTAELVAWLATKLPSGDVGITETRWAIDGLDAGAIVRGFFEMSCSLSRERDAALQERDAARASLRAIGRKAFWSAHQQG